MLMDQAAAASWPPASTHGRPHPLLRLRDRGMDRRALQEQLSDVPGHGARDISQTREFRLCSPLRRSPSLLFGDLSLIALTGRYLNREAAAAIGVLHKTL